MNEWMNESFIFFFFLDMDLCAIQINVCTFVCLFDWLIIDWVIGWLSWKFCITVDHKNAANDLQELEVKIISPEICKKTEWNGGRFDEKSMICAGIPEGGKGVCRGDSGGPLQCEDSDGRWTLVGLTSWGYGCAKAKKPGMFTNVAAVFDWIKFHIPGITYTVCRLCDRHRPLHV